MMALRLRLSPQKERRELFHPDGSSSSPLRNDFKQQRAKPMQFSFGQALALAAVAASASAILTSMVSAHSFSLTMTGQFLDQQPLFVSRQLRPSTSEATIKSSKIAAITTQQLWEDNPAPKVVWLMSFPNRCAQVHWFCGQHSLISFYSILLQRHILHDPHDA